MVLFAFPLAFAVEILRMPRPDGGRAPPLLVTDAGLRARNHIIGRERVRLVISSPSAVIIVLSRPKGKPRLASIADRWIVDRHAFVEALRQIAEVEVRPDIHDPLGLLGAVDFEVDLC